MPQKKSIVSEQSPAPLLPEKLLTIEEVQARLNVGRNEVYRLIAEEGLPVIRWGEGRKLLRFHPDTLARWLLDQAR